MLLNEYESGEKYVNLSLRGRRLDGLTESERSFLTRLLYTAVERKITYDYYISSLSARSISDIDTRLKNILRLGLVQLTAMDNIPRYAAVDETVRLCDKPHERSFVNGVLRAAVRAIEGEGLPLPPREKNLARYLSVAYSFPLSLCKRFIRDFGEADAERLLSAFGSVDYTDLTVNPTRSSREALLSELSAMGLSARPSEYSALGVRVFGAFNPMRVPSFASGAFFVQDAASLISAEALGTRAGDTVVDVCSCPGGKSFAAAALSGGGAKIYAFDLHSSKLSLVSEGAERLGFGISVGELDGRGNDASLLGLADRVICDVPCSGLGVLGKKPDIRYRAADTDDSLPDLQYEILCSAARYLRLGGELLYSTCTLSRSENEEVFLRFLSESSDFECCDFSVGGLHSKGGMLTLLPHIHGTDGFFMAKLRRIK